MTLYDGFFECRVSVSVEEWVVGWVEVRIRVVPGGEVAGELAGEQGTLMGVKPVVTGAGGMA